MTVDLNEAKDAILNKVEEFLEILGNTIFTEPEDSEDRTLTQDEIDRRRAIFDPKFREECTEMLDEILYAIDQLRHRELVAATLAASRKVKSASAAPTDPSGSTANSS